MSNKVLELTIFKDTLKMRSIRVNHL